MENQFKKKWYKKTWGKVIIVIFTIFVIFTIILSIMVLRLYYNIRKQGVNKSESDNFSQNINFYNLSNINKSIFSIVNSYNDPSIGPVDADLIIVEFFDFECSYCKEMHSIIRRLSLEYKENVRIVFRNFPILTEDSELFALSGECAHEQKKFLPFSDKVFAMKNTITVDDILPIGESIGLDVDQFQNCIETGKYLPEIQNDLDSGLKAGVEGTPYYFVNGNKVPGALSYDEFKNIIEISLNKVNKK